MRARRSLKIQYGSTARMETYCLTIIDKSSTRYCCELHLINYVMYVPDVDSQTHLSVLNLSDHVKNFPNCRFVCSLYVDANYFQYRVPSLFHSGLFVAAEEEVVDYFFDSRV